MNKNIFLIIGLILLLVFSGCNPNTAIAVVPNELNISNLEDTRTDSRGNEAINSIFSDSVVGVRYVDVAVQFQYNIFNEDTKIEINNGSSVLNGGSMLILSSGTNSIGNVHINSVESLRYRPGHEGYALFTSVWYNGCVANSEQLAGIYNENEDGYYMGCINNSFVVGLYKGGIKEYITSNNFNGDLSCNYNISQLNIYRISFGWLGIAPIKYETYCGGKWRVLHTIDKTNLQQTTTINNPVLPIQFHIINYGNTKNISMGTASWNAGIINGGSEKAGRRDFNIYNSKTISANTQTNIITIKSNETYWGKTNRIDTILEYLSLATDGTKAVDLYIVHNANITGGTWQQVDINNSVMQYNLNGTYQANSGHIEHIFVVQKVGDLNEHIKDLNIHLHKNETISLIAVSTNNNDIDISLRWEELY